MQTVLITGGTGMVGKQLTRVLINQGYAVIVLTRNIPPQTGDKNISYALWNVQQQTIDVAAVQKADAIIHLAGAGVVAKKWTDSYKKEIVDSRTKSSELLINTLKNNTHKVKTFVSASAIGWYGEDKLPPVAFTEKDIADKSFLGDTCKLWEQSVAPLKDMGIRLSILRIGIVLSNDGGALVEFKKTITTLGLASILASGKQMVSWIHIEDLCKVFLHALKNEMVNGVYNAVAPNPVSNKNLTVTLANIIKGRYFIPIHVPTFILKIMLGSRSVEVLKSTFVNNDKIMASGYQFLYPTIQTALQNLCKK
jgi:uncharacterized protein